MHRAIRQWNFQTYTVSERRDTVNDLLHRILGFRIGKRLFGLGTVGEVDDPHGIVFAFGRKALAVYRHVPAPLDEDDVQ